MGLSELGRDGPGGLTELSGFVFLGLVLFEMIGPGGLVGRCELGRGGLVGLSEMVRPGGRTGLSELGLGGIVVLVGGTLGS